VSEAVCTLQADLHGCQLTVLASKIGRHVGKQGIVVQVRTTKVSM
jgi:Ribonuclease P/MRP, subunit p29